MVIYNVTKSIPLDKLLNSKLQFLHLQNRIMGFPHEVVKGLNIFKALSPCLWHVVSTHTINIIIIINLSLFKRMVALWKEEKVTFYCS